MNIYKIYNDYGLVAIEDDLSTVREMARLTAEQTSRLFRKGKIKTAHFSIVKY